jgi:hypothetical protein
LTNSIFVSIIVYIKNIPEDELMSISRSNNQINRLLYGEEVENNAETANPHSNRNNATRRRLQAMSGAHGFTSSSKPPSLSPTSTPTSAPTSTLKLPRKIADHNYDDNPGKTLPFVDTLEIVEEMRDAVTRYPFAETFQMADGNAFEASGDDAAALAAAIILLRRAQQLIVATGNEIIGKRTNIFLNDGWCYLSLQGTNIDYSNSFAIDAIGETITPGLIEDANNLITNATEICRYAPQSDSTPILAPLIIAVTLLACVACCFTYRQRPTRTAVTVGTATESTELLPRTTSERKTQ